MQVNEKFAQIQHIEHAIKTIVSLLPIESKWGVPNYGNYTFSLRPYSDADYYSEDFVNESDVPPHFIYHKTGFNISWYKHPGRGLTWTPVTIAELRRIVIECLVSVS